MKTAIFFGGSEFALFEAVLGDEKGVAILATPLINMVLPLLVHYYCTILFGIAVFIGLF